MSKTVKSKPHVKNQVTLGFHKILHILAPVLQKILHVSVYKLNRYYLNKKNTCTIDIAPIKALFKYCSTEVQYLQYLGEMEPKIRMQYFVEP